MRSTLGSGEIKKVEQSYLLLLFLWLLPSLMLGGNEKVKFSGGKARISQILPITTKNNGVALLLLLLLLYFIFSTWQWSEETRKSLYMEIHDSGLGREQGE